MTHHAKTTIRHQRTTRKGKITYKYKDGYHTLNTVGAQYLEITDECGIDMAIDVDKLIRFMGQRAASTKSGVSKLHDGLVVARVTSRKEIERKDVTERSIGWLLNNPDKYEIISKE